MAERSVPSTMRAWQYSSTKGGLEKNLELNASAALPKPKQNQHLVQIIATALNPVDYKPAEIPGVGRFAITKPATPGIDFVGTIVKPASASSLKAGQLVFGCAGNSPLAGGAMAEYAVSSQNSTAAIPDSLDPLDATTLGVAAVTAYQSIVPHVKEGGKVFINGGSGGTGIFGIQIAKAAGCHVTTTCSTVNVDLCKSLGADNVIDYKEENVLEVLKAADGMFDHAVDNVGTQDDLIWHCHEYLLPKGLYVVVGAEPSLKNLAQNVKRKAWPGFLGGIKRNVTGFWPQFNTEDLKKIADWVAEGKVKPIVDQKFSFDQGPQAIERLKTGRAKGKIVIEVSSNVNREPTV